MYFIPMGITMAGQAKVLEVAGLTASQVAHLNLSGFISNLIPVTLGNIVGGTFVGSMYWLIYLRKDRAAEAVADRPWLGVFSTSRLQTQPVGYIDTETQTLISVLARARDDARFMSKLSENPNRALKAYDLTPEAKAALESGDVRWLVSRVGTLDEPLRTWLSSRLAQEKW